MKNPETDKSTYQDFVYLRAAIVRAIGLAWRDEGFEDAFKHDPKAALKDKFGYEFPFDWDFKVKEDPDYTWTPESTGGWSGPNNTIRMMLPNKPEDPKDVAEALAAYNLKRLNFMSE